MIRREQQLAKTLRRAAFTLMEMLVVVAIIVALAGMGGFYFMGQLEESKKSTAKVRAKVLKDAIGSFTITHGREPTGWAELYTSDGDHEKTLEGRDATLDPWGKEYNFDPKGDIFTTSPKGVRIPPAQN
jgi:general secretion pathway protein G